MNNSHWEKGAQNRFNGQCDVQAEPWNINLCSVVQKPDDKDGKGYSKEIVQHEQKHREEIFFPNNYLSKINSLE